MKNVVIVATIRVKDGFKVENKIDSLLINKLEKLDI